MRDQYGPSVSGNMSIIDTFCNGVDEDGYACVPGASRSFRIGFGVDVVGEKCVIVEATRNVYNSTHKRSKRADTTTFQKLLLATADSTGLFTVSRDKDHVLRFYCR